VGSTAAEKGEAADSKETQFKALKHTALLIAIWQANLS
jgi:hypothetical protein